MNDKMGNYDTYFFQLIFSLQAGAMQQMGKIASPVTGKIERDLQLAKVTIDMLDMLQRKTEGNLNVDEKKLLDHVLYELRINYVDEVRKGDGEKDDKTEERSSEPKPADKAEKSDKKDES
ncbi:MAG: DUF1844 domain-containing protein [Candidatus Zixiibacteriota bacterium]